MDSYRMVREWAEKCLCNFTYGITLKGQRALLNPEKPNLTLVELADQEFLYSIYENISSSEFLDLSFESQISIVILSLATVIGITANIYVLVTMAGSLNGRTKSSPLMINIAVADLLLLVNAPLKIYLLYKDSISKFNDPSTGAFGVVFCKYYHGVMQLGMLATLLNVTMTAVVRYSSLTSWFSYSESTYKKIGLFAWILAAVFTVPIFLYADVFIVGEVDDTASQVCRIRWSRIDRNECKEIVLHSFSDCNVKSESCRQQEPNERVYYLIVLFLGVILPIGISYLANIAVVRQLISHFPSPFILRFKFILAHQSTLGALPSESPFVDKRQQQFQKTQKAVKRNVFLFAFAILISWCPVIIWHFVNILNVQIDDSICSTYYKLMSLAPWLTPVLNPVLYVFAGKRTREKFVKLFRKKTSSLNISLWASSKKTCTTSLETSKR